MGSNPGKELTQEEKITQLEKIVGSNRYAQRQSIFAKFILEKYFEKNQIHQDIIQVIIPVYWSLVRDCSKKGATDNGFLTKKQNFTCQDLIENYRIIVNTPMKKVYFEINIAEENYSTIELHGKIKGTPTFSRNYILDVPSLIQRYRDENLSELLLFPHDNLYTDRGIEFSIPRTLAFLYDFIYSKMYK